MHKFFIYVKLSHHLPKAPILKHLISIYHSQHFWCFRVKATITDELDESERQNQKPSNDILTYLILSKERHILCIYLCIYLWLSNLLIKQNANILSSLLKSCEIYTNIKPKVLNGNDKAERNTFLQTILKHFKSWVLTLLTLLMVLMKVYSSCSTRNQRRCWVGKRDFLRSNTDNHTDCCHSIYLNENIFIVYLSQMHSQSALSIYLQSDYEIKYWMIVKLVSYVDWI